VKRAVVFVVLAACGGGRVNTPPPGRPILAPAEPPTRPAAEVCGELVEDLAHYGDCVEPGRKDVIAAWHEYAATNFAALAHDTIADRERAEVARGCAKADTAIKAALARCPTTP
jgi:hypothetical protein